ncbi:MAG: hypothetical protein QXT45_04775 [Candidatus Bilamarchaeaceae archaeon]
MLVVRKSTPRTVIVGPVLDANGAAATDAEVTDFKVSKNGGNLTALDTAAELTHRSSGYYSLALAGADVDTIGQAEVVLAHSTYVCPIKELVVVEQSVYDALFAAGAEGYQKTIWASTSSTVNLTGTTIKAVTDGVSLVDGAITSNKVADGALTEGKFAAGAFATLIADVAVAVWDRLTSALTTANSIGKLIVDNLNATISSRLASADYTAPDNTGISTLLGRLTSARAGYLDNLNVGGPVASQADIDAINQSASRRVVLATVATLERPDSGNASYLVEARTYSRDGALMNASSTPTLSAEGIVSGDLSSKLSSATNPSTGVYRWTYTVASTDALEQVRFDFSGSVDGDTVTMSAYSLVTDATAIDFTSADRSKLESIYNKLPTGNIAGETQATTNRNDIMSTLNTINTKVDDIAVDVDAILDDTGVSGVAISDSTKQSIATTLLDLSDGVESNRTVRKSLRLMLAALVGKLSGAGTSSISIRDTNDTKNRIVATVDTNGNRSAITLNDT